MFLKRTEKAWAFKEQEQDRLWIVKRADGAGKPKRPVAYLIVRQGKKACFVSGLFENALGGFTGDIVCNGKKHFFRVFEKPEGLIIEGLADKDIELLLNTPKEVETNLRNSQE